MAPTVDGARPMTSIVSTWNIHNILDHPWLLVATSSVLLGLWALARRSHIHVHQPDLNSISEAEQGLLDRKDDLACRSFSDLPPPLRSVVTSSTLAADLATEEVRMIISDPPTPPVLITGPWRRQSYPSPQGCDLPALEIKSDETTFHPDFDDEGARLPGLWRRRTLVFEMPPHRPSSHADEATETQTSPPMLDNMDSVRRSLDGLGNLPLDDD